MTKLVILLLVIAATASCMWFGLPAFSVIMALLACLIAGLTAGFVGTLVLTNKYATNYEVAFTRSFWSGIALSATVVVGWTATLNLLAGGTLLSGLVANLWTVSLDCAIGAFGLLFLSVAVWAVMVFGRRRTDR